MHGQAHSNEMSGVFLIHSTPHTESLATPTGSFYTSPARLRWVLVVQLNLYFCGCCTPTVHTLQTVMCMHLSEVWVQQV